MTHRGASTRDLRVGALNWISTMGRLVIPAACALMLSACDRPEVARASGSIREPIAIPPAAFSAASLKAAKVVAYRFALPGDGVPGAVMESGYSLITKDGALDVTALERLKVKEATLNADQVARLVDAVYGDHEKTGAAACYDPHHIFLFHDRSGALFHAVEMCFACTNLHAQPPIAEPQWCRHDFRELARICDEAGIGMVSGSAEDQIRLWDERDQH